MRVAALAESLGVTADTVRFYTRVGFLQPRRNPDNGYKEYRAQDRQRLRFILSARQLGFSVEDIGQILAASDKGKSPCQLSRQIIEAHLQENERRLCEMIALHERMKVAVASWEDKPDQLPTGTMICHLIEDFCD